MSINIHIEEIVNRLTMEDVIKKYTNEEGRHNRIPCPFHEGEDRNFSYNDKLYQCWVCGAKGNVFSFVKDLLGLNVQKTIFRIDYDFNLGLELHQRLSIREKQLITRKQKKINEERKRIAEIKAKKEEEYWAVWDEYNRLFVNKEQYKPKSPEEPFHELYVEACHKIDYQKFLLDVADIERRAVNE